MGVKHLWSFIDPIKEHKSVSSLQGKTLAVDLSIWVCEALTTTDLKKAVQRPYLRNILFRILCLRKAGIKLVFIIDGKPPDLKGQTIINRKEAASSKRGREHAKKSVKYNCNKHEEKKKVGRNLFNLKLKECCQLLDLLGMPYICSAGEAEALCALLNLNKVVDGCLTDDSDAFLYGASTIYKDLGISKQAHLLSFVYRQTSEKCHLYLASAFLFKDPHVYSYELSMIEKKLGLSRVNMIAMALLLGCDYTNGVRGVGRDSVFKLLREYAGKDLLQRFQDWRGGLTEQMDFSKTEEFVVRKVLKDQKFPNQKVIQEFLLTRDSLATVKDRLKWTYPNVKGLQEFLLSKLEWPEEYTLEKILPCVSMTFLERKSVGAENIVPLGPKRVVKTRIQHGVPLCEVEWVLGTEGRPKCLEKCSDFFTTLESQQLIIKLFPALVDEYHVRKKSKKGTHPVTALVRVDNTEEEQNKASGSPGTSDNSERKRNDLTLSFANMTLSNTKTSKMLGSSECPVDLSMLNIPQNSPSTFQPNVLPYLLFEGTAQAADTDCESGISDTDQGASAEVEEPASELSLNHPRAENAKVPSDALSPMAQNLVSLNDTSLEVMLLELTYDNSPGVDATPKAGLYNTPEVTLQAPTGLQGQSPGHSTPMLATGLSVSSLRRTLGLHGGCRSPVRQEALHSLNAACCNDVSDRPFPSLAERLKKRLNRTRTSTQIGYSIKLTDFKT